MDLISQFTSSIRSGVAPLTVNFVNTSSGPYTSVKWNFGDGNTSTEINPTHQYLTEGTFEVSLTIFSSDGKQNVSRGIITVFAQSEEDQITTQRGLYVAKRFESGQVQVKSETLTGSTFSVEYPFDGVSSLNSGSNGVYELGITVDSLTGSSSTTLKYDSGTLDQAALHTFISNNSPQEDFEGYIGLLLGGPSGNTSPSAWNLANQPSPMQFYKVVSIDTGSTEITIDRNPPQWSTSDPITNMVNAILVITKTGTTSASTYDSDNYRYMSIGVGVDSYDDFYLSDGFTNIDNSYGGILPYFGLDADSGQTASIGTIRYSGYAASEKFKPGSIRISIPWVMWHESSTSGINLYDVHGEVEYDASSGQAFKYLRDGQGQDDNIVGKVFYDKKAVVITDRELNATLNFTSNRNWTLPKPRITVDSDDGTNLSGIKYYITYKTLDGTGRGGDGFAHGWSNQESMHCNYIQIIEPSVSGQTFRIKADDSPWITSNYEDGTGFSQQNIWVLVGTGSTDSTYPTQGSVYYSSMTLTSLSNGVRIPDYSTLVQSGTQYENWWGSTADGADNEEMPFGSHGLGFAYMSGSFESTIYKMAATCVAKNNEFNATQNKTYNDKRTNENIYITEVALYNENNELLMIGKLNKPIKKNDEKFLTIKMEIDL